MLSCLVVSHVWNCGGTQKQQHVTPSSACHIVRGARSRRSSSRRSNDATVLTQGVELCRICHFSGARCGYRP